MKILLNKQKVVIFILDLVLGGFLFAAGAPFPKMSGFAGKSAHSKNLFRTFPLPDNEALLRDLDSDLPQLAFLKQLSGEKALRKVCAYFKEKAAVRYYFNWKNFSRRLAQYEQAFPEARSKHLRLAREQTDEFSSFCNWQQPVLNRKGQPVTAYRFRHLARQSKLPDIVLAYFFRRNDKTYLDYFLEQVRSLNAAFRAGNVETGGNAVFEVFRTGKRMHHWLFAHHAFLSTPAYSWKDQLLLLRTFLHHARILAAETAKHRVGNHHTRGLVALFEIAALFPEFKESDRWKKQALNGILWHMKNEINADGFQFERSGHYHKGDIENYLRVYQLAQINGIPLPSIFRQKFESMFGALAKLALPDGNLPVLQDDTDGGSDTEADLKEPMAVGAMVFKNKVFRFFSGRQWPQSYYWLLTQKQLQKFNALPKQAPDYGSLALKATGYYVMRDGWNRQSNYMLISAGLEKRKPDHQHGDMLGIIGFAHNTMVLPNYKVHYNRPDYSFLKNSWAKNVALADSQAQGRGWQPNRGGSGFGKWKILPEPKVLCWQTGDSVDYFSGSHNGFLNLGVHYIRDVVFVRHHFWLVYDQFAASGKHSYQQIWQGKFTAVNNFHLMQKLKDGQTFHLVQLRPDPLTVRSHVFGKHQNTVFRISTKGGYDFITLLLTGKLAQKDSCLYESKEFSFNCTTNWAPSANVRFRLQVLIRKKHRPYLLIGVNRIRYNGRLFAFAHPIHLLILSRQQGNTLQMRFLGPKQQIPIFNANGPLECGTIVQLKI